MRYLYTILMALVLTSTVINAATIQKKYRARITYYDPYQDKWGWQNACQKTKKSSEGITVAAHPDFKFGTKLHIPALKGHVGDGKFIVQDRGGAVTSKKASKGKAYVFDVFVASTSKRKRHANQRDMYMDVYVITEEPVKVKPTLKARFSKWKMDIKEFIKDNRP